MVSKNRDTDQVYAILREVHCFSAKMLLRNNPLTTNGSENGVNGQKNRAAKTRRPTGEEVAVVISTSALITIAKIAKRLASSYY